MCNRSGYTTLIRTMLCLAVLVLVFGAGSTNAQNESGAEEKEYLNAAEIFLGGVTETETDENGFGIGVEYNRRLARQWSIGIEMIEISTTEEGRSWLVVVPIYFHPVEPLSIKIGAGLEGSKPRFEDEGDSESETEFAVRFGVGWEFEAGSRYTITPEVNLDLIDGRTTLVYGLSFGLRF